MEDCLGRVHRVRGRCFLCATLARDLGGEGIGFGARLVDIREHIGYAVDRLGAGDHDEVLGLDARGKEVDELIEIAELPEDNDMRVEDGETHKCIFRFKL